MFKVEVLFYNVHRAPAENLQRSSCIPITSILFSSQKEKVQHSSLTHNTTCVIITSPETPFEADDRKL